MYKGLIQGSVEASKLFGATIAEMLLKLSKKWAAEGKGILFGKFCGLLTSSISNFLITFGTSILNIFVFPFLVSLMTVFLLPAPCVK